MFWPNTQKTWKQNKTATTTKQAQEEKKNVCKSWALLKISKLRKQTHKELVPLLVLEEQAQVASKRLELITKYKANTLMLLLFSTVSGATIRQNFDFFTFPHSTNPTNHCDRSDRGGMVRAWWLYCLRFLNHSVCQCDFTGASGRLCKLAKNSSY